MGCTNGTRKKTSSPEVTWISTTAGMDENLLKTAALLAVQPSTLIESVSSFCSVAPPVPQDFNVVDLAVPVLFLAKMLNNAKVIAWHDLCECVPDTLPPPFTGGQCSEIYQCSVTMGKTRITDGVNRDTTYPSVFAYGPIAGFRSVLTEAASGQNQASHQILCHGTVYTGGSTGYLAAQTWVQFANEISGIDAAGVLRWTGVETVNFVRREGNVPDTCGDLPDSEIQPEPEPPPLPPVYPPDAPPPPDNDLPPSPIVIETILTNQLFCAAVRNCLDDDMNIPTEFVQVQRFVRCVPDEDGTGQPEFETQQLQVIRGTEAQTVALFGQIAELQAKQCVNRRIYSILGGDQVWGDGFVESEQSPERDLEIWGENQDLYGPGQPIKVQNLIDLIQATIAVPYWKVGLQELPARLPKTLLSFSDSAEPEKINSFVEFFAWFVKQFDALVGKFPIEIEITDIDPLTAGDQTKKIELSNLSEALAEVYGLGMTSTINSDLAINFLARLASEIVATKNAVIVTQDYAKANADYLGYKGNPTAREIDYAFDVTKIDSIADLLTAKKMKVQGWKSEDKESVATYLQKLAFAAQIIKASMFRSASDPERVAELISGVTGIGDVDLNSDDEWRDFIASLNNPNSRFNRGNNPQPKLDNEPNGDS